MSELVPDMWRLQKEDDNKCCHQPRRISKRGPVTDILLWIECYSILVGVLTTKYPMFAPDFMVSKALLCYYSSFMACKGLTPQSIKTHYLAALRHTQMVLGLPEPSQLSSLPSLKLVQAGIQRAHAHSQRSDST